MKNITLNDILPILGDEVIIKGNRNFSFNNIPTSQYINEQSLDWANPIKRNKVEYVLNSKAPVILCEFSLEPDLEVTSDKCLIFVSNPKLTFLRIAERFFVQKQKYGIHPSAIIHEEAEISNNCYIGPNSYLGKCKVGKGTIIHGNCYIYDNTTIGEYVTIHAGTVIGADGFGYQRNENGKFERFPHIGGVIIENNVDIGSNTSIDRGALGFTIIEEGVKIDNQVHIAHNVKIGKHTAVTANSMIAGSTIIGEYTWIAPSAAIRDQITIGKSVTIGMGAVVLKNVPDEDTWAGSPALAFKDYAKMQKKLKKLL